MSFVSSKATFLADQKLRNQGSKLRNCWFSKRFRGIVFSVATVRRLHLYPWTYTTQMHKHLCLSQMKPWALIVTFCSHQHKL
jgi:hypothetical protein